MNTNPALLIALAIERIPKTTTLHAVEESGDRIELRIYDPRGGTGYWFVRGSAAGRWYYMPGPGRMDFSAPTRRKSKRR
jgi:hypothetical protein